MRHISLFARAALVAMILVAAPSFAGAASSSDAALANAVSDKLMEGKNDFDATSIIVTSEDGVIHLRGSVQKRGEIQRMEEVAKRVPGVKSVESQIDVAQDAGGK
ncbi:putative Transport-associated protein [uncultured delta proteobacterium]|uniref:Putative Transport-associated protein n=1 Tax=uncultured delta proteobacterium TaxID=34034 RepID=A0A212IY22_9DELT|nr:putative Transport-associated protein [uncultured delta proteobacterium]